MLQKIALLSVMIAAVLAGYSIYQFINKKINPRQSFQHFMLYMLLNLLNVLLVSFLFGFVIIYFKTFFIVRQ
jgi:hypothetical protein